MNSKCNTATSTDVPSAADGDAALLRRVQHCNQQDLLGKLLHDLRNPIHSIRITMDLFARIARGQGDLGALVQRATLYIGPGEAAVEQLVVNCERLGRWLTLPSQSTHAQMPLREWLEELALLLRACRPRLRIELNLEADPDVRVLADRVCLGHAMFRYCLERAASHVFFELRLESARVVQLEVRLDGVVEPQAGAIDDEVVERAGAERAPPACGAVELHELMKRAGGAAAAATSSLEHPPGGRAAVADGESGLLLEFERADAR